MKKDTELFSQAPITHPFPGPPSARISKPSLSPSLDNWDPTETNKTKEGTVGRNDREQRRPAMQINNNKIPKVLLCYKRNQTQLPYYKYTKKYIYVYILSEQKNRLLLRCVDILGYRCF